MKLLVRIVVSVMLCALPASAQDPLAPQVDRLFAAWDKPDSPGCALGVIQDGKLVYQRGYGSANLDYNIPLSSTSVFYIASTSKQFTAASILLLARSGKLSLDDDVRTYIPALPRYEAVITINHLVHHTSGLRDYLELMAMSGRSAEDQFDNDAAVELIARQQALNYRPGEKYLYSNSNYVLMAEIVKRVSGKSLREFADENLFKPLGMANTHFNDDRAIVVKNRVISYSPAGQGRFRQFIKNINAVGDGNLLTTVEDLARWDRNFYDNRVGGPGFSDAMLARMKLNNGEETAYGFGLGNEEYRGLKAVAHGGAFYGFRTEMVRIPAHRFTVICLCNVGSANPSQLARKVVDLYLGDKLKPVEARAEAPRGATPPPVVTAAPAQLADYAGAFYSPELDATYQIVVEDGKLQVRPGKGARLALIAQGNDGFKAFMTEIRFTRDATNRVTGLILNGGRVKNLQFMKK
ncbi:MAG: serine hydrolase domain-containing protein [Blastocatellia bacterium]|nr:serine hydrolase domain-containing protein [Blastocatellia bacterium]